MFVWADQTAEGAEDDDPRHAPVVIVDDRLAHRMWPGTSAVGLRIALDPGVSGTPSYWATVVGVVQHVRHRSPVEDVRDQVYFPARQITRNPSVYLVKTTGDPRALVATVRDTIRSLDAALPIADVRSLAAYVADAHAIRGFTAVLAALFAAAALMLATVGIYGVVAYAVAERRRELGVRVALGAGARDVLRLVLAEGAMVTAAGLALGLAAAAAGSWWLRAQLVGVAPWDPVALTAAVAVLILTALLACAVPAGRALRIDPADVLREV